MPVFAPSRLKGFALTMTALAVAIGVFGILAKSVATRVARAMVDGDSTMEGGQENVVGGRISGVLAEIRSGVLRPDTELGVILGASAVGTDIEPALLDAAVGPKIPSRWLILPANGAHSSDIRGLAELLTGSKLDIKLLVLGLHPTLLARADHYLSDAVEVDARPFFSELEAGRLSTAKEMFSTLLLTPLNRVFEERTRIGHQSRVLTAKARRWLFGSMGLGADSLFAPVRDPWFVQPLIQDDQNPVPRNPRGAQAVGQAGHVAARDIREGPVRDRAFGAIKDKGWYDRASYSATGANARDLIATIREARSHHFEVVLALLPERSEHRSRVPQEATACLQEALRGGFGGNAPLVIDIRDAIPDELFHDDVHLNREARSLTTLRLIEALRGRPTVPERQEKG